MVWGGVVDENRRGEVTFSWVNGMTAISFKKGPDNRIIMSLPTGRDRAAPHHLNGVAGTTVPFS